MALQTDEMILNMGPQHPSTHGVLRLELVIDGEFIVDVKPHIGYLHRCFEKHAEACTYPQIIPYVDRMDYVAAMYNEFAYALAVEKLLGLEVPPRVEYIRIIMGEFQRIASHLIGLGTFGLDTGTVTPFLYCFRDREKILSLFNKTSGARLLYNYIWIGGLAADIHYDFLREAKEFINYFRPRLAELNDILTNNKIFIERTANIGVLDTPTAVDLGLTGPNLRATGLPRDLRKEKPYSRYDEFEFEIPVGKGLMGQVGDSWDRYYVRVQEIQQSLQIIEQALEKLPEGDVQSAIPKRIKPTVGQVYSSAEGPRGELGFFIISNGKPQPHRIKVRAPSFLHVAALGQLARGHMIADLVTIIGSIDIVLGEVDR